MRTLVDTRYAPSPRTARQPMAFTGWEFVRGALLAWLGFVALGVVALGAIFVVSEIVAVNPASLTYAYAALVVGFAVLAPWSLGALILAGAPIAYLLGRTLRGIAHRVIHLASFATLGFIVGAVTTGVYAWISVLPKPGVTVVYERYPKTVGGVLAEQFWLIMLFAALTAVAVAFAWWRTSSWALRGDTRCTQEVAQNSV